MILRALNLGEDKSKTDGGLDISRLQLLISKGGAGKSYILGSLITLLKENDDFSEDNYLMMASIGKVASAINS